MDVNKNNKTILFYLKSFEFIKSNYMPMSLDNYILLRTLKSEYKTISYEEYLENLQEEELEALKKNNRNLELVSVFCDFSSEYNFEKTKTLLKKIVEKETFKEFIENSKKLSELILTLNYENFILKYHESN